MSTPIRPIGPYTPVVRAGPWLICSGQLGVVPPPEGESSGAAVLVEGGVPAQLTQALTNAAELLRGQGATIEDVVKTTVFVTDPEHFAMVNEAYPAFFGDHRPARSMVAVTALPAGASVEVEVWAYRPVE
jgi:2-iminobutanoate/2-iminopropanoate deaminase